MIAAYVTEFLLRHNLTSVSTDCLVGLDDIFRIRQKGGLSGAEMKHSGC